MKIYGAGDRKTSGRPFGPRTGRAAREAHMVDAGVLELVDEPVMVERDSRRYRLCEIPPWPQEVVCPQQQVREVRTSCAPAVRRTRFRDAIHPRMPRDTRTSVRLSGSSLLNAGAWARTRSRCVSMRLLARNALSTSISFAALPRQKMSRARAQAPARRMIEKGGASTGVANPSGFPDEVERRPPAT